MRDCLSVCALADYVESTMMTTDGTQRIDELQRVADIEHRPARVYVTVTLHANLHEYQSCLQSGVHVAYTSRNP